MIEIDEIISNAEYCADVYERMNKAIHPALQVSDYKRHAEDHRQLAEWLKELKQLREQTRWIPVNEELPEDGEEVLTCSTVGFIEIQSLENPYDVYWENQKGDWTDFDEVIAWMPLPEPYKAESEET